MELSKVPVFAGRDDGLEKIRLEKLGGKVLSVREAEKDQVKRGRQLGASEKTEG